MKFLITCPFGLSSLLTSELKHLGLKPFETFPTGTYVEGDEKTMMQMNLRSRIANKVFLQIGENSVFSFDELFDFVESLNFDKYIFGDISISAFSQNSKLFGTRAIQSICHKAILGGSSKHFDKLSVTHNSKGYKEKKQQEIFVRIENDLAKIFVNTSGESLHKRGWRKETGEAPLKENLAAGLVLLGGWKFKEKLWDPFCGSGTICIEAAMIAKNIAPGLKRSFDFEKFKGFDMVQWKELRETAKNKIFDKKYEILGTDIDPKMIEIARKNAKNAGVDDCIVFETKDFLKNSDFVENIISNPPYGKRITAENIEKLYQNLIYEFEHGTNGGFLTSMEIEKFLNSKGEWKTKQINNNGEMCTLWRKL